MANKYIKAENGPGNLVVAKYSRKNGMIGNAGGFAVFPDYTSGHYALLDLLVNDINFI